jgi:hypothetical protein
MATPEYESADEFFECIEDAYEYMDPDDPDNYDDEDYEPYDLEEDADEYDQHLDYIDHDEYYGEEPNWHQDY